MDKSQVYIAISLPGQSRIVSCGQDEDVYSALIMGHENIATTQKYLHYAMDIIAARADVSHINKLIKEVI